MKKLFLTIVAAIFVLGLQAQTVSTAYMTLTYCQPNTDGTKVETICNTDLPYTWVTKHGNITATASEIVDGHIIKHVEFDRDGVPGCKDYYDLDLTIQTCVPTGAINGLFSVNGEGKQIYFSKGNLRFSWNGVQMQDTMHTAYNPSTKSEVSVYGRWRFADNQWDLVTYNKNSQSKAVKVGDWFDLFIWGTSGMEDVPNRASCEIDNYINSLSVASDNCNAKSQQNGWYLGAWQSILDPGICHPIENGGNTYNTWRVITHDEWNYIINSRDAELRARASVNGVYGLVILPDNWTWGTGESGDLIPDSWNYTSNGWTNNSYTGDVWTAMENAGAVFLPMTGSIRYDGIYQIKTTASDGNVLYLTSTVYNTDYFDAGPVINSSSYNTASQSTSKAMFYPIRLVQDAK